MTESAAVGSDSGAEDNGREAIGSVPLRGGELNAAVTSALVGVQTEHLGRGPNRALTFYHGNVLVTLMYGVLSRPEKSLLDARQDEAVRSVRRLLQQTIETDACAAVERLTGRKVLAFISGNQTDPDIATEVFVLDGPL